MKYLGIFLLFFLWITYLSSRPTTDDDIARVLREMDKRFELVEKRFEQIDKRFEQIDKRFEQIDKRFEFIQSLLIALLIAVVGSPFLVEYFARRRDSKAIEA